MSVTEILRIATGVATPLALLGLVAALGYLAYARRLRRDEATLEALPREERANAADEYLTRYGIDGRDLPAEDRLSLIKDEMQKRHQLATWYVGAAAIVFMLCFVVAVVAFMSKPDAPAPTPGPASPPEGQPTQTKPPEFNTGVEFSTSDPNGHIEPVEFVPSSRVDSAEAQSLLKLEQIEVDVQNDLYRVTVAIHNPWNDPLVLDLNDDLFSLKDDTGYHAQLIHSQYPERKTLLAAADSRKIVLYFKGEGWIGKHVSASSIIFEVRGLSQIVRASWRMPVLATAD